MEKKEVEFFTIDGKYYGGDQNWHTHKMMKMGGCSAVTACEVCIWLAKTKVGMKGLYPYDPAHITKTDFLRFFEVMFRYIHPGIGGLTSVDKFAAMLRQYVDTTSARVDIEKLMGNQPYQSAEDFIRTAIDDGRPVMYLMLRHSDKAFGDYEWHWFTITGYECKPDGFHVTFATWGEKHSFSLERAWATGKAWRGGMVALELAKQSMD